MISFKFQDFQNYPIIEKHITVKAAAKITGYNAQYLRRLLRLGKLDGVQVGQVWLIQINSIERYISQNKSREDRRCGPRINCNQS